jgi:hypothetical protein
MKDSDWKYLFRFMRQVLALSGGRDEQRQAVEEALERFGGKDGPKVFDQFCALNLDGADEVIGDEEYEEMMKDHCNSPKVLKMRKKLSEPGTNGLKIHEPAPPSLFD